MRTIKNIHNAEYGPIADLTTYCPLPNSSLDQIDPFLLINHHGPQEYPPQNNGLPFGPHPHRGMETVTFILAGDIMHRDSTGHESVIHAGGIQWMTAGKGLIHAEVSTDEFKTHGGDLEILQLWLNLPSHLKLTEPFYKGLQQEDIPKYEADDDKVVIDVLSGQWGDTQGGINAPTGVQLNTIHFKTGGKIETRVPVSHNIFFYLVKGSLEVNGTPVETRQLVEFSNDDELLKIAATTDSTLIFGHAQPFEEPVVAQGPFVMNTEEEIRKAFSDYQQGKFGVWGH